MNRKALRLMCGTSVFIIAGSLLWRGSRPEGMYAEPNVANGGRAYYEFIDGEAWFAFQSLDGMERRRIGKYFQESGNWVIENQEANWRGQIKSSLLGMQMVSTNGQQEIPFRVRLWRKPKWARGTPD